MALMLLDSSSIMGLVRQASCGVGGSSGVLSGTEVGVEECHASAWRIWEMDKLVGVGEAAVEKSAGAEVVDISLVKAVRRCSWCEGG